VSHPAAALALAALGLLSLTASRAAAPARLIPARAPRSAVLITYRSPVRTRALLRREALRELVPRLEMWRRNGTLAGYQLLLSSFVDRGTWDLLAILTFDDFAGIDRWRAVERSSPGGLDARQLRFLTPSAEYLMDIVARARAAGRGSRAGVFLVIPYVFSPTPLERYLQYARGYILPETEGWMRHGNISGYALYVNRFYPDEPVQSLLVIEYTNFDALSHREAVVEQTRKELSADPAWRSWSEAKGTERIRTEKRAVIAEQLAVR
jgi:hypothetical protein